MCPPGYYYRNTPQECLACGDGFSSFEGSIWYEQCFCLAGYYFDGERCRKCADAFTPDKYGRSSAKCVGRLTAEIQQQLHVDPYFKAISFEDHVPPFAPPGYFRFDNRLDLETEEESADNPLFAIHGRSAPVRGSRVQYLPTFMKCHPSRACLGSDVNNTNVCHKTCRALCAMNARKALQGKSFGCNLVRATSSTPLPYLCRTSPGSVYAECPSDTFNALAFIAIGIASWIYAFIMTKLNMAAGVNRKTIHTVVFKIGISYYTNINILGKFDIHAAKWPDWLREVLSYLFSIVEPSDPTAYQSIECFVRLAGSGVTPAHAFRMHRTV
ncbi:unnamed protein product [Vitrella brassicaformis CCMP3155]|uniref:Tyrosine-protein kinase ephrin type A/B receptor-like domain-containing protein n=1 Tax=Vitrella brassicaformis (strain CCMP3155) TaxID=1169540 RepID=A0A0G4G8U8_VITBC|nr:unnamed protein product [Vitrella brassicaformis CCMP3155]|eukprot:CEM25148.1 unnamed protein product [Vitrella brassicaformis CCMP3155]